MPGPFASWNEYVSNVEHIPLPWADLKLTGEGDLESAFTATVFPTWHPTVKLLWEYFFELANFLRFGWHWVPDMKVYAITSCPVMTPLWCPPLLEKCVPIVETGSHSGPYQDIRGYLANGITYGPLVLNCPPLSICHSCFSCFLYSLPFYYKTPWLRDFHLPLNFTFSIRFSLVDTARPVSRPLGLLIWLPSRSHCLARIYLGTTTHPCITWDVSIKFFSIDKWHSESVLSVAQVPSRQKKVARVEPSLLSVSLFFLVSNLKAWNLHLICLQNKSLRLILVSALWLV